MTGSESIGRLRRALSVAPMMARTDRHFRYLARLLTPDALLYTEMVTTGAILHGDRDRHLLFDPFERPVALQLGGASPADLAACAAEGASYGYDEINLNVGCPSDRAGAGRFGACLMGEPALVAECVAAMRQATALPVTVKCRIGIGETERYDDFAAFVDTIAATGCRIFIVHTRRAVLGGLSPKENREIPPLRPDFAHRLKSDRPELEIVLNGGLTTPEQAAAHRPHVDGVMIGRAAYEDPTLLPAFAAAMAGGTAQPADPIGAVEAYLPYVEARLSEGVPLNAMTRHLLGLFRGRPGARAFRRTISEGVIRPGAGPELIRQALAMVSPETPAQAA